MRDKMPENIVLDAHFGSLLVFVDDTGHEKLVDGHLVYGLGGCAVMADQYDKVIKQPWNALRSSMGKESLHASKYAREATREHMKAMAAFFSQSSFARFAAIISVAANIPDQIPPMHLVSEVLKRRIVTVSSFTRFLSMSIIFEHSQRAAQDIQRYFDNFEVDDEGMSLPVEKYFMHKRSNEPGLEVADFIMHAVGRQERHFLDGKEEYVPDFQAIFHNVSPHFTSFMRITKAEVNGPYSMTSGYQSGPLMSHDIEPVEISSFPVGRFGK